MPSLSRLADGIITDRGRQGLLDAIAKAESGLEGLDGNGIAARACAIRQAITDGRHMDEMLAEAFALVGTAVRRTLNFQLRPQQLLAGIALHEGRIVELAPGEGKTLAIVAPAYLHGLTGRGVHVLTTNDYLARRDAAIVGKVLGCLGVSVGVVVSGMDDADRRSAYQCDVTYVSHAELGFDYLRDDMRLDSSERVLRDLHFAIVDEADSVLLDEARTPLVLAAPCDGKADLYRAVDAAVARLSARDVSVDEGERMAVLTDAGVDHLEALLRGCGLLPRNAGLFDHGNADLVHHVQAALKARHLFKRDRDYIVREGEIVIVDEFTGRAMPGRRYADCVHQAIEAKEGVEIRPETLTLNSISYQNLFRSYPKLAGITGTAMSARDEFIGTYGLDVCVVPSNKPSRRVDEPDRLFRTEKAKYAAIVDAIVEANGRGQPVLVGTTSIEKSEIVADLLEKAGFRRMRVDEPISESAPGLRRAFHVLNARHHEDEARIIARAGRPYAVTISTNMAGRGTDIQLGGNMEEIVDDLHADGRSAEAYVEARERMRRLVEASGGLFVIGTERHESRRIDDQLRGRAGRQGQPGRSCFFVSLEDDLATRWRGRRYSRRPWVRWRIPEKGLALDQASSRFLDRIQRAAEAENAAIRRNLQRYDDVIHAQRKAIFDERRTILAASDVSDIVMGMCIIAVEDLIAKRIAARVHPNLWDVEGLQDDLRSLLGIDVPVGSWVAEPSVDAYAIKDRTLEMVDAILEARERELGSDAMRRIEKRLLLSAYDRAWQQHIVALEGMRSVVWFRTAAQRDPLAEFRAEAADLFSHMMMGIARDVTHAIVTPLARKKAAATGAEMA